MLIENINILKKTYPHIGNQLKSLKNSLNKELVKLEEGRNGQKTIYVEKDKKKIYFNSKYNPLREAEVIIEEYKTITDDTIVVFYGLGLGYHIDLFLQKHPNVNYYIYETVPEIFYQYISNKSLNQLKNYKLKNIGLGNDIQEITMFLKDIFKNMEGEILLIELPIHKQTFNEEYKIFFNLFQKLLKNRRDSIQPNVNNDYFENDNNKSISKDANYIIKDPYAHILYDVRGIFSKQYKENIFNRMDIVVRYLAIEEYYGKNNYGFGLYEKMQKARGQTVHNIYRFKDLIKSINENGFSEESSILVDQNLQLIDGSHRLACALYFNAKRIPIKIDPKISDIKYSIDWFEYVGFTKNELKIIEDKQKSILEEKGIFFVVTLWPPAQKYFDEIASELSDEYSILSIKDYTFENEHEFNSTIRGQYAVDDIESWKIEKKLQYMQNYNKKIRMLTLDIGDPKFRSKAKNNKPISIKVEEIKKKYRQKYSKKIDNYFYDIIMHIGDNYEHSDHMVNEMKEYKYNVIKIPPKNNMNKWITRHINDLNAFIEKYNLRESDFCIVGSSILELKDIRKANDVDVVVVNIKREKITRNTSAYKVSKYVEVVGKGWAKSLGIEDEELITNSKYHFTVYGFKFVRLELLYLKKLQLGRYKDMKDLELIRTYISRNLEWDYSLIEEIIGKYNEESEY